jgi:Tfp pilus assembly protein PilN
MGKIVTINLFNYREELKRIGIQRNIYRMSWVAAVFVFLCAASDVIMTFKIVTVKTELAGLDGQVKALQSDVDAVNDMKKRQERLNVMAGGIQTLRNTSVPTRRLLEDIFQAVPEGLWLTKIQQLTWKDIVEQKRLPLILFGDPEQLKKDLDELKKDKSKKEEYDVKQPFVEIVGQAHSENAIAALSQALSRLPYYTLVFPHQKSGGLFYIYCYTGELKKLV